jgi:hypothetical protein
VIGVHIYIALNNQTKGLKQMIKHLSKKLYAIVTNYNDLPGDRKGSIWKHGAVALYHNAIKTAHIEWCFGHLNFGVGVNLHHPGDENDISGKFCLPGASFYWGLSSLPKWKWVQNKLGLYKKPSGSAKYGTYTTRRIGLDVHNWTAWISLWKNDNGWSSTDPKWWSFNATLDPREILLGKRSYKEGAYVIHDAVVDFPMLEKTYQGRVKIQVDEWRRPRWPWPLQLTRAHVSMIEPIPFPGKGENSWDCGDDALHGSTFLCNNVEEAIGSVVGTVLRYRMRYGRSHKFTSSDAKKQTVP